MISKSIKKVLLLGSGGLKIGQAGEFDYSGSQAIKALKEEGIKVVLLNPNVATVQTDSGLADSIYFLPITEYFAEKIIEKEKPDGILLGFGGQTALNVGLELDKKGVLKKHGMEVLGTGIGSIRDTEDRGRFIKRLNEISIKTPRGTAINDIYRAAKFAKKIGYPVMMRSGFALGGANSGVVKNQNELSAKLKEAFKHSPQILIEECLTGWKEIEYEILRDRYDNCIAVCNMENFDPMGIHTGDSIVVAPSQTLNNFEYHMLRETAIKTVRHLKIVGECNIQFALNPQNSDYRVIEVNARLSRSSALASKATGYPLAFVAAKLALGYSLTELENSITKVTRALFEPALDYLVLKMPRWDFDKFRGAERSIGSEMRSVGEVMAIGRKFEEVLQKAIRMTSVGQDGLVASRKDVLNLDDYLREIKYPTDRRIFAIAKATEDGVSVEKIRKLSGIDPWFLEKIKNIVDAARGLKKSVLTPQNILFAKQLGFSDIQLGVLKNTSEFKVRALRHKYGIRPVVRQIDTLAGEFPAKTNYLYLTYNGGEHDVRRSKNSIIVLGSGSYSIGSSVEFDWCGVQAVGALKKTGFDTIVINYNPETVSTDYDVVGRLYFDELSLERVLDICEFEKPRGTVISTGGQIANNLALSLHKKGVKILGTHPYNIDRAEDRHKFSSLLDRLGISQPPWVEASDRKRAESMARKISYPILVRPSYVLSGTAISVIFGEEEFAEYLARAAYVSQGNSVVISKFLENARELEIDGVAEKGRVIASAFTEHIENAGTHSGDATIVIPPQGIAEEVISRIKKIASAIVRSLNVTGPFNVQFLFKDNELLVIECNLRASRTFPFVSKATGKNFVEIAISSMLGRGFKTRAKPTKSYVAVKSPQFSYQRIKGADPVTYVEMTSTGEVASFGKTFSEALLKSMLSAHFRLPRKNVFLSLGREENKIRLLGASEKLSKLGYNIFATENTADFLKSRGVPCKKVYKIHTLKKPNVLDILSRGDLDLIVNVPSHYLKRETQDGYIIRRTAVDLNISLISNAELANAFIHALSECPFGKLEIKHRGEY